MATQFAFGQIVTNGLVLALDAADRNSYVSGSTTWNSLLGTYSGSLFGSCSFSTGSPATFVNNITSFQSQSSYLSLNQIQFADQSSYTLDFWVKLNPTVQATFHSLVGYGSSNPWLPLFATTTNGSSWYLTFREAGAGTYNDFTTINYNISSNWANITLTADTSRNISLYLNGAFRETKTLLTSSLMLVSRIAGGYQSGFNEYNWQGSLSSAKFYNRTLPASEIAQNYNAVKSRFNL